MRPLAFRTFEDLTASQDRLQMLKSRHRSSAAFDPADQIARVAGKPLTPEQDAMAEEARDLHAQRMGGADGSPGRG